jgi:hypothetical protein
MNLYTERKPQGADRTKWLPGLDSNQQPIGYTYPSVSRRRGLYHSSPFRTYSPQEAGKHVLKHVTFSHRMLCKKGLDEALPQLHFL